MNPQFIDDDCPLSVWTAALTVIVQLPESKGGGIGDGSITMRIELGVHDVDAVGS